ncbi:hypothetical protein ADIARSV_2464 [Arcticibacter svalbardensis MN12-7]|uniref:Uncharacterized protein n=1 Tax=Arcticibacter svalbardensis MN12-7 TaxID=1150600 RepID=R9GRA9_9SPHI|nr:hypothetical protein ADIARSV_2464 [Arcticibacter svalbardensis MN12-7]
MGIESWAIIGLENKKNSAKQHISCVVLNIKKSKQTSLITGHLKN